jgi:hypothetical protein
VTLAGLVLAAALLDGRCPPPEDTMPLVAGSTWTYEGVVAYTPTNSVVAERQRVVWPTKVREVACDDGAALAVLEGFVADLAGWQPGERPRRYALVLDGPYLYISSSQDLASLLGGGAPAWRRQVESMQLVFVFPERQGSSWHRRPWPPTSHPLPCFMLDSYLSTFDATGERRRIFQAVCRSLPDHLIYEGVPGVGLVGFSYEHHGTVGRAAVRLVRIEVPPLPAAP